MEQMAGLASLVLDGALERHPRLRVALLESGSGWIPYWLERLDSHVEWMRGTETGHLTLAPSEYFERQCVVATETEDSLVGVVIARYGAERVVWASDFPHPDGLYPDAVATFLDGIAKTGLDPGDVTKVLWDTPLRFYGLERRFGEGRKAPRHAAVARESGVPDASR
ncbi:MAG: amidohydrolase family protein, partial [Candidatus Binatia bacterium]